MNCVISMGVGDRYQIVIDRLNSSLNAVGYSGGRMLLKQYPQGCPNHSDCPYGFKPYLFHQAIAAGYTNILWLDSALIARKPLDEVFAYIEKAGWLLFRNGFNCGQWCTEAALGMHRLTRDEAMAIPDFTGCCMGLNVKNINAQSFLTLWKEAADDGVSFKGDWKNDRGQCSADKRCLGHRHDQVIGSIIAHRLNMKLIPCGAGTWFSYHGPDFSSPEYQSVVLSNEGA